MEGPPRFEVFGVSCNMQGGRYNEGMTKKLDAQLEANAGKAVNFRSPCPVARTLDILGDKWSLLIIRDLIYANKRRYGEFAASPEKIPTNILSDRLKRLERHGIVERNLYSQHPPRAEYHITEKGKELGAIVKAVYTWGAKYYGDCE